MQVPPKCLGDDDIERLQGYCCQHINIQTAERRAGPAVDSQAGDVTCVTSSQEGIEGGS